MNPIDPESAIDTERRRLEEKETRQAPNTWSPASVSDIKSIENTVYINPFAIIISKDHYALYFFTYDTVKK